MKLPEWLTTFWKFLKEDTWQSWVVSLLLAFIIIKFVFFPGLSFAMGTSLPLVVVESCSMYHPDDFESWWSRNGPWYQRKAISETAFEDFPFHNGLNKGDIIVVTGRGGYSMGDVIIFDSEFRYPLIHRVIDKEPYGTKGDKNPGQLTPEKSIAEEQIRGKALMRIPALGWFKLIFFEWAKPPEQRGFC